MKNLIFLSFIVIFFISCSTKQESNISVLNLENQNAYTMPKILSNQKIEGGELLEKRFSVFSYTPNKDDIKDAFWAFDIYTPKKNKTYYGSNFKPILPSWFEEQEKNANKDEFLKLSRLAISVTNTAIRNFPTNEPIFYNPNKAGEGYPFDYLQASNISIAKPIFVSHLSLDRAWAMVKDDTVWGWVKINNIKFINDKEATKLQNSKFIILTKDKMPIYDTQNNFLFYGKIGALLPYYKQDDLSFIGEIQTISGIKKYKIPKAFSTKYPAELNDENIQKIASSLLGQPYGWGGLDDLRDCSLFTKDFLGSFGIWLPRNSSAQSKIGTKIELEGLSNEEKLNIIKEKGIPYTTLFYLNGHIMLYIGIKDDKVLALHDAWGIKTKDNGRALIGQIAITPLDIGANLKNVDKKSLLLSKIKSMNIITK
ncbi:lipoprotein, NlpC/P60 family (SH3 domains) [Campylobacter pinnipediorum subsp. caledonicus]|uniref:SH3 domain-containing C40 family peptidase n=1 Tax=Campylobacter pinnipediorum TaxID=1965231 RepID=UPI0009953FD9|nr:SH3 domain-containing C40 family peptidase [Campylobacter pinnipediorum]AQW86628.1 lipoprotein, NlpC/P60 family (SH3 domains) [Campylobacter pinnipediorum subsp. caledonicus]